MVHRPEQKRAKKKEEARKRKEAGLPDIPFQPTPADIARSGGGLGVSPERRQLRRDVAAAEIISAGGVKTLPPIDPEELQRLKGLAQPAEQPPEIQEPKQKGIVQKILSGEKLGTPETQERVGQLGQELALAAIPIGRIGKIVKIGKGLTIGVSDSVRTTRQVQLTLEGKQLAKTNALSESLAKHSKALVFWALGIPAGLITTAVGIEIGARTTRRITAPERIIKSIESDLGLMSEQIPDIVNGVVSGLGIDHGMELISIMRGDIANAESSIKTAEIDSLEVQSNPHFTDSAYRRIAKQREKLDIAEIIILKFAANPQDPDIEKLALLLEES